MTSSLCFTVLFCTLLASAQSQDERDGIESEMSSNPDLASILNKLQETEKDDIVMEERARRQAARQSRVDADLDAMDTDEGPVRHMLISHCHVMMA